MGARNRVGIGLSCRPTRLHSNGIDSLESMPGLLKSLKIRALKELLSGKGEQKELYRWMCSVADYSSHPVQNFIVEMNGRGGGGRTVKGAKREIVQ
jgi:hypothetical protein